jgi:capsular exopolysaccharide synthesis family protein
LGKTVLLVDADLRQSSLHRAFDVTSNIGLVDILLNGIDWRVGLQETPIENLRIVPSGGKPHNPSELLSSRRMQTLLKRWKECFDVIIFDSPIIPGIPDVAVLAPAMDGVLLVHYPAHGDKEAIVDAKKLLEKVGARCVGMVFNNIKPKDKMYYASRYGSLYQSDTAKLPANGWGSTDFIDMRPTESRKQWQVDAAAARTGPVTTSGELDKSAQSTGLHVTLKGYLLQQYLAGSRSANGCAYLTLDMAIYNGAEQPHLFDPALTTITVHWKNDYSQALASVITIPAIDSATASQRPQVEVYHYDPITQTIDSGIAGAETISPKHLVCGRLVYQVPEEATHYLFGYEHNQVRIAIAFSK